VAAANTGDKARDMPKMKTGRESARLWRKKREDVTGETANDR
jgi:hypothetical protein